MLSIIKRSDFRFCLWVASGADKRSIYIYRVVYGYKCTGNFDNDVRLIRKHDSLCSLDEKAGGYVAAVFNSCY